MTSCCFGCESLLTILTLYTIIFIFNFNFLLSIGSASRDSNGLPELLTPLLPLCIEVLIVLIVGEFLLRLLHLLVVLFINRSLFQRCKGLSLSYKDFLAYVRMLAKNIRVKTTATMLTLNSSIIHRLLKVLV